MIEALSSGTTEDIKVQKTIRDKSCILLEDIAFDHMVSTFFHAYKDIHKAQLEKRKLFG